jgi:putative FmdB family regulatory protein
MPIYEYRCVGCGVVTSVFGRVSEHEQSLVCEACGHSATRIISTPSVHLSKASKLDRLDPRYDKLVDNAMQSTPMAEPDRLLKRMKPPSGK